MLVFLESGKNSGDWSEKKAQGRTDLDVSEHACASGCYAPVLILSTTDNSSCRKNYAIWD